MFKQTRPSKPTNKTIIVDQQTIAYREVHADDGENLPIIIGLHGYGSSERQLETLVPLTINNPHIYVAPRGFESVDNGGYGWYPITLDGSDFQVGDDVILPALQRICKVIDALVNHYQSDLSQVYIVGYSMGGSVSMMLSLTYPDIATAYVTMAGILHNSILHAIASDESLRGVPVFVGHGILDNLISSQDIQSAVDFMNTYDMCVSLHEYRIPHVVGAQERDDVSAWLNKLIG